MSQLFDAQFELDHRPLSGDHSPDDAYSPSGSAGVGPGGQPNAPRPHSGGSFLPYDDPNHSPPDIYSHQQQQPQFHFAHPQNGWPAYGQAPPPPPPQSYGPPQPSYGYGYPGQPPAFDPQAAQGQWAYDRPSQAPQPQQFGGYYGPPSHAMGGPRPSGSSSSLGVGPSPGLNRSQTSATSSSFGGPSRGGMQRMPTGSSGSSMSAKGPPITKQSVDEYRQRIKADPDPEAQFNFAKYLIEAAKKIHGSASGDEKAAKKYRDALLAESVKLIKRLATTGPSTGKPAYADAQFFLANCLGNGSLGLQVDHEKAYNLYVQASKQNHSSATYRTAVCNEVGAGTRRDHARAVLFYRKASALGDTAGMYKLGMILLNGLLGQQRNPKEAFAWLKRAAAQADEDNPHALHELGLVYEQAPGSSTSQVAASIVQADPAQARELFTQAGQYGYPPSQFKLGAAYEYGALTCPVDPRRSIAWYTRAAERGDAESELALSGWYLTGSEGTLKQSDSEAYLWARRAANKGLPKAEYAVGYYSEVGIGVKQDGEEAKRWYMRAAAQGNRRAMQRLTELKKIGAERGKQPGKGPKGASRPTRQQAESECIVS